jgi:hypothetical protein
MHSDNVSNISTAAHVLIQGAYDVGIPLPNLDYSDENSRLVLKSPRPWLSWPLPATLPTTRSTTATQTPPVHGISWHVSWRAVRVGVLDWPSWGGGGASPIVRISVYSMRMARVNITVPDELLGQARAAGLNVSRLAAAALAEELDRRAKIAELDVYLAEMDAEFGPVPAEELAAAAQWADRIAPAPAPTPSS